LTCLTYGDPPTIHLTWELPGGGETTEIPAHLWFCE
jgi:hypothetical protein